MAYLALGCRALVGLVFVVSAVSKLRSAGAYREFVAWLAGLALPLASHRLTPAALAGSETAVVVLLALPATAGIGMLLAAALLATFTAGVFLAVRRGARAPCRCFGGLSAPPAKRHVLRNAALFAAAVTGVAGAGATDVRPGGVALALGMAAVVALLVFFSDDVAALLAAEAPAAGQGGAGQKG